MNKVKIITAWVPLPSSSRTGVDFQTLGARLVSAIPDNIRVFRNYPIEKCWAYYFRDLPPATPVPADRFASPEEMTLSNIQLHERATWARMALNDEPDIDMLAWIDYGIMKQGAWTGHPVTEEHIIQFVEALKRKSHGIPFPSIEPQGPIPDDRISWRFVGSTVIMPAQYVRQMEVQYRTALLRFIKRTQTVPHDTPIWAHVERASALPFWPYPGNHDATQFTNYPS